MLCGCKPSTQVIRCSVHTYCFLGFPDGSVGKESTCNAADMGGLIPGLGRSPEENGNPLQYSCLKNPMDRGDCLATFHGVAKSQTQLSMSKGKKITAYLQQGKNNGHMIYFICVIKLLPEKKKVMS